MALLEVADKLPSVAEYWLCGLGLAALAALLCRGPRSTRLVAWVLSSLVLLAVAWDTLAAAAFHPGLARLQSDALRELGPLYFVNANLAATLPLLTCILMAKINLSSRGAGETQLERG